MADVNRGNRPLSPHLTVYRPQWTSMLSILHRVTGIALTGGTALAVIWLLAAATGPELFAWADWAITSWFGTLVMLGMTFSLSYHFCNGVRHLFWDAGYGFQLEHAEKSGMAVVAGGVILTALVVLLA